MSSALEQKELAVVGELEPNLSEKVKSFLPVILPVIIAGFLIICRAQLGPGRFLYEGTLTILALVCYITASVILLTNLLVKDYLLSRLGLITIGLGFSFNFSGWMIRWIEAGDAEGWKEGINGIWRYYPLDTLYALTLGFCCGAAIATLFVIRKPSQGFLGALSTPLISVILTIAVLFGNEIRTLMPILDSYWRPIHVSIATLAYGICLVSFGLAFAYLFKAGVRSEVFAISIILYGILIYCSIGVTINGYGLPTIISHGEYGSQISFLKSSIPARAVLPGVGLLMVGTLLLSILSLILFTVDINKPGSKLNRLAWIMFRGLVIVQGATIGLIFFQVNQAKSIIENIPLRDYEPLGVWLRVQLKDDAPAVINTELAKMWLNNQSDSLSISLKSNPVEVGAIISMFVLFTMIALFSWKREVISNSMPTLESIDSLLYRSVSIAFPLLCMLLITGAVWANESWGRYWGWDPKETGALVATMAYAAFLHTRIAHGWRGKKSAYFALIGFALVIFTWLGVSFLLPGLHSYAQV